MFGYITIDKGEMLCKDYEAYKAVYCSLCKQLGKEYSFLSRFILSYDCTFYAVVALSLSDECAGFRNGRCAFNPLKKCNYLKSEKKELSIAAALSVITLYYKIVDNIADGAFFEKLGCLFLKPLVSLWHNKAKKEYPQIEEIVSVMSDEQFKVEKEQDCSVDKSAEPTAQMLAKMMSMLSNENSDNSRIYYNFGYFLGKWIYLCDAADDYADDVKKDSFNPYVNKYKNAEPDFDDINASLNHCLSEVYLSSKLMNFKRFDRIIENILVFGLPKKQKEILTNNKTTE